MFDKLVAISVKYSKAQHAEALEALTELREEQRKLEGEGVNLKNFKREITRQENRVKMDEFDSRSVK